MDLRHGPVGQRLDAHAEELQPLVEGCDIGLAAGQAVEALGDDDVELAGLRIGDEAQQAGAVERRGTGDGGIVIDRHHAEAAGLGVAPRQVDLIGDGANVLQVTREAGVDRCVHGKLPMSSTRWSRHGSTGVVVFVTARWRLFGLCAWRARAFLCGFGGVILARSLPGKRLCQREDLAPCMGRRGERFRDAAIAQLVRWIIWRQPILAVADDDDVGDDPDGNARHLNRAIGAAPCGVGDATALHGPARATPVPSLARGYPHDRRSPIMAPAHVGVRGRGGQGAIAPILCEVCSGGGRRPGYQVALKVARRGLASVSVPPAFRSSPGSAWRRARKTAHIVGLAATGA